MLKIVVCKSVSDFGLAVRFGEKVTYQKYELNFEFLNSSGKDIVRHVKYPTNLSLCLLLLFFCFFFDFLIIWLGLVRLSSVSSF